MALPVLVSYFIITHLRFASPVKDTTTMSEPWHDINDPGYFVKPVREKAAPAAAADDSEAEGKADAIVTLSDAKFVPPDGGSDFNDTCPAQVSVAYKEQTSQTRVTFKLFCTYNGEQVDLKHKVDANESGGTAEAQLTLYYPDDYSDGSVDYFFTAEHSRADKTAQSATLTLPYSPAVIVVRLPDGDNASACDNDSLRLFSTDSAASYSRTMAFSDGVKRDGAVEFEFGDIKAGLTYALEIKLDGKDACPVFEDLSCGDGAA
ncbi:MAG TPA: hypothetical protein VKF42_01445 [Chitinivibrionales bacterium]|nr:hypothetical protein [Chitinivibrionales bacterium]